jgi:hypothetical protein
MPKNEMIKGILLALGVCVLLAAYAVVEVLLYSQALGAIFLMAASFGCFGLLLGGIFAFDEMSEIKVKDHAGLRIFMGCVAGCALALLWRWSLEALFLSAIIGAVLGYFGMKWAQYVDFYLLRFVTFGHLSHCRQSTKLESQMS